jgi:hypothetical protein
MERDILAYVFAVWFVLFLCWCLFNVYMHECFYASVLFEGRVYDRVSIVYCAIVDMLLIYGL